MSSSGDIRVLHVDDDSEFAAVAAAHLERADERISVVTEPSAQAGLDRLRSDAVDCVVSDHDMPGTDGLEFLKSVRAEFPALPFILFTGKGSEEIASDAISAGVTEYLQKDVGTEQYAVLANRIRRAVGEARAKSALAESERELEQFRTLVEAVGDPVYALDAAGRFTFVNEAIEPMTGYSPAELVGEHIGTIMTGEDVERGDELIESLLADDEENSGTLEMDVVTKAGEQTPSENNLALLPARDDQFAGTAGVIRDIRERKEREQRLAEFASVVSHDLRNPLNVVQGRLELARETGDVSHLDAATESAARMEQLIDDLLTLARQGDTVGTLDTVDLATAAENAWKNVDTVGAILELAATDTFEADPDRLAELLGNLFRNSVEHGRPEPYEDVVAANSRDRRPPDDAIDHERLTVTVGTLAAEDGGAGFYVADDGQGIPEGERDSVFERGYTTATDGTGFGLAIVEDIASAHGWAVTVTESESGGARFEFRTTPADQ